MPAAKRIKITVTSAEGNPKFLVDKGTQEHEIKRIIRHKFGYRYNAACTARFPHDWTSEEVSVADEENLYLKQKIADVGAEKDQLIAEISGLKKVIKRLKEELLTRQIKIGYLDRTKQLDWLETAPEREDRIKARKAIEALVLRETLAHLEEKLAKNFMEEIRRDEIVIEKDYEEN